MKYLILLMIIPVVGFFIDNKKDAETYTFKSSAGEFSTTFTYDASRNKILDFNDGVLIRPNGTNADEFFADDSGKLRVSGVVLRGRESDCVAYLVRVQPNDFQILDSVLKVIYINKPANLDNVTFNNIPNREWVRVIRKMRNDPTMIIKDAFKEVRAELLIHGGNYISSRILRDDNETDDDFNSKKKQGQNYAQKKDDDDPQ